MAGRRLALAEVAVLVVCSVGLVSVVLASTDCSSSDLLLEPCLSFVTGNASSPANACCTGLATVISDQPVCVCELLGYGGTNIGGVFYNLTLATELPGLCNVSANASECPALISGAPASSPGYAPIPFTCGGGFPTSGASRKMPGTILNILQFAAAPAVVSLLLRVYLQA